MLNFVGVLLLLALLGGGALAFLGQPVIGLSITTGAALLMFLIERFR